jgi:hypothetical protein
MDPLLPNPKYGIDIFLSEYTSRNVRSPFQLSTTYLLGIHDVVKSNF